jgi:DNA-directed RNA polymerase specialized sigma24 family protein
MMLSTTYDALDTCALRYRGRFQASARRVLGDAAAAQDAVQDAMVSAMRNLPRFRGDSQLST